VDEANVFIENDFHFEYPQHSLLKRLVGALPVQPRNLFVHKIKKLESSFNQMVKASSSKYAESQRANSIGHSAFLGSTGMKYMGSPRNRNNTLVMFNEAQSNDKDPQQDERQATAPEEKSRHKPEQSTPVASLDKSKNLSEFERELDDVIKHKKSTLSRSENTGYKQHSTVTKGLTDKKTPD